MTNLTFSSFTALLFCASAGMLNAVPPPLPPFLFNLWQVERTEGGGVHIAITEAALPPVPYIVNNPGGRFMFRLAEHSEAELWLFLRNEDRTWTARALIARSDDPDAFVVWPLLPDGTKADLVMHFAANAEAFHLEVRPERRQVSVLVDGGPAVEYRDATSTGLAFRLVRGSVSIEIERQLEQPR